MPARALGRSLLLATLCVVLAACSGSGRSATLDDYSRELSRLQRRLAEDPADTDALTEVGVIYVRTRNFGQGMDYLERAFARHPDDPRVLFHLGTANEAIGKRDTAVRLYASFPDVALTSPYRRLMQGRYQYLQREIAREEIRELLAAEADQADTPASAAVMAVVPLVYRGSNARYAPLGRGLSEMLTVDLANVPGLTLVERIRLQALLDELQLARSGAVDASTAPRMGRLLGAGRIVAGTFDVQGQRLLLSPDVVAVDSAASLNLDPTSGALAQLFNLEKEMVFGLIDELGIELTPDQRERIERVPTQSLQAFLAYSNGLEAEDAGDLKAAARHFRRASRLDPGFSDAVQRAELTTSLETAVTAPAPETAVMLAAQMESALSPTVELLTNRVLNLNATIGAVVTPSSQESRESVGEVATTGPPNSNPLRTKLPDPPRPPGGGN